MRTITITASEYASRYGCSTRYVQGICHKGDPLPNTVGYRQAGNTWLIQALTSWYEADKGLSEEYKKILQDKAK